MTVMALMAVRRFALFTSRPRALGSTCNGADADDAPLAVSAFGTSPVGCGCTEADGGAPRFSAAWRRRACRSCRFDSLLGYCAPEALDQAFVTGCLQDAIKVLDQPDRWQLLAVLHFRQV